MRILRYSASILLTLVLLIPAIGCTDGPIGKAAADFTLPDLNRNQVSLNDFKGKPVLLNFWQMDCPECILEMPYLQALHSNPSSDITVLTVSLGDSVSRVTSFLVDNGYSFPVLFDDFGYVAFDYSIRFTPTTYLLDSLGTVVDIRIGPFSDIADLNAFIEPRR